MEKQHILKIAVEYRGRYKKGITIFNASEASLQQKCFFLKLQKDENNETISKVTFFWVLKMSSVYLFRVALCEFVLDKVVLFHWVGICFRGLKLNQRLKSVIEIGSLNQAKLSQTISFKDKLFRTDIFLLKDSCTFCYLQLLHHH